MTRSTAFISLAAMAFLAAAPLAARADGGTIVGGGGATISGGGDNMVITYSAGGAGGGGALSQPGRLARFTGSHGDGSLVEYLTPAPSAEPGREARLVGGGENAEVVYDQRR